MLRLQMNSQHHRQLVKPKVRLLQAAVRHSAAAAIKGLQDSKLPTTHMVSDALCSCIRVLACVRPRKLKQSTQRALS
jgi:hypothetical protein